MDDGCGGIPIFNMFRVGREREGEAAPMETSTSPSPPSSPPSMVVNSPRLTVSLARQRRGARVSFSPDSDEEENKTTKVFAAGDHGPKPSEVYGFVGSISTVIATVIYLAWAYTPESWLHSLGITYYPNKYWALAVPAFAIVTVVLMMVFYLGLNFMATPPPTSFNTLFDEHSRERSILTAPSKGEQPIEPISDLGINQINDLIFGHSS